MKIGQECWTTDGRKAVYAGEINGQKFVRPMYFYEEDEGDYEEWPGDQLRPVSKVLTTEPKEVVSSSITSAEKRIADLRDEESKIRTSVLALRSEEQELRDIAAKHPDIQLALDFYAGRITHVVTFDYGPCKILEFKDFMEQGKEHGDRTVRLIGLYGTDYNGKQRWAANRYSDGSGVDSTFKPFRSLEEAQQCVLETFEAAVDKSRNNGWHQYWVATKHLEKNDFLVCPDDLAAHVAAKEEEARKEKIAELQSKIDELKKEVPA